ncbi:glycosyltransferase 61 family protein [Pseudoprimorskyibacter insulae]|uniref:Glycosyltransferase 61 catalytic domain-containing protein n=1 Tax=Pseudoprimorskyibacter insulae TaxID=1695997 RepID=A0A2R8B0J7_9RHOB|nr:glycosyltransferase 61 family protein [Pseudoprimorskyibacter insulae]SPF81791.1 hypothetical protein PRI8871_03616 [Pseudoprimorskyibacter insulae]
MSWFNKIRQKQSDLPAVEVNPDAPSLTLDTNPDRLSSKAPGLYLYPRTTLPAMARFEDIPVVPVSQTENMVLLGGPVWPNWRSHGPLRHNRSGTPVDRHPPAYPDQQQPFDTPATWGGHAVSHFGHFIAEHSTRILQASAEHGDKTMLFTLEPNSSANQLPKFFWQILSWFQVDAKRLQFVHKPLKVRELWAAPMAEQWAHVPTSDSYLDLLAANTESQGLTRRPNSVVYVARDRMEATAEGHNAGETYLTQVLQSLGVTVIRPEAMPLREQLEYYHGAETLIFAEGSAMHGRQLLGRRDQTIVVLNRRPNMRIGLSALHPRVSSLAYAETTIGTASVLWPGGKPWIVRAISLYDVDVLLGTFDALGIPLSKAWDTKAYLAARDHAIRHWIQLRFDPRQPIDHAASVVQVRKDFAALGLDHLIDHLPKA